MQTFRPTHLFTLIAAQLLVTVHYKIIKAVK
jgi:hypothetical protein